MWTKKGFNKLWKTDFKKKIWNNSTKDLKIILIAKNLVLFQLIML